MTKKTVLVTGASRGIGKAISLEFAKHDYNVVINCMKSGEKLMQTKDEVESYGASCLSYVGDIGIYENAEELFKIIDETYGAIDVLVNNAGISYIGLFQDMKLADWNRIIQTNLTSVYNCCHFAIPAMVSQKSGKIINISSVWGVSGASCEVAYSATKGAINALTKALGKELAPSNIQVNAIACGAIDTEMNQFLDDEELMDIIEDIPAGRLGTAKEIAKFVLSLCQSSPYLTGEVIKFDGGWI